MSETGATEAVLEVDDLVVEISGRRGRSQILYGVSLDLYKGEMRGLVGETGSGKSMTGRAVMGLLPHGGRVARGDIRVNGRSVRSMNEQELAMVRGREIAMIFQNPRTALHPLLTIEKQMSNVLDAHFDMSAKARRARVRDYLALAGIPDPERIARSYPHELSGGLAQRVVIGTVMLCDPVVVIADEPTTGLDATVQRQILDQIAKLQEELSLAVLMITHDLGIVAQYCDTVSVMNSGRLVEHGAVRAVLTSPSDAYTRHLMAASRLEDEVDGGARGA